jgi:transposase InsO family protein
LHEWIRRYAEHGVAGLVERSHRPASCPHQMSKTVEARVIALRAHNPHWGPASIAYQLAKEGIDPVPGQSSIYRALLRHDLVGGVPRKRRRQDYLRWERGKPMELWQLDLVGFKLADGTKLSVLTGVDDHSRFCVLARGLQRASAHLVCEALAGALRTHGVPEQILTDNGKVFTSRLGPHPGETLFDKVCGQNGIEHILTRPYSPTTTGKIERFHRTLRLECLARTEFVSIEQAQESIDRFVEHYNTVRPHQALEMATPATRFYPAASHESREDSKPQLTAVSGNPAAGKPTASTRIHKVVRKVDVTGSFGLACERYSAGRWLYGELVTVRCVGEVVEIHHNGQLIKAHPRKHSPQKEETMHRRRRKSYKDKRKVG